MDKILDEFGMPYYCKVDIEGNDQFCFAGMSLDAHPRYMSVELSEYPFVEHMHEVGYDRFKLIHQLSFSPVSTRWFSFRSHIPNEKARAGFERIRGGLRRSLIDGSWYFKIGSSGPLPEDTPGGWMTYEQATVVASGSTAGTKTAASACWTASTCTPPSPTRHDEALSPAVRRII